MLDILKHSTWVMPAIGWDEHPAAVASRLRDGSVMFSGSSGLTPS